MDNAERFVYVASPLGFAASTRPFMTGSLLPAIQASGAKVMDPWDLPPELRELIASAKNEMALDIRQTLWDRVTSAVGRRNLESITKCRGLVAVLDGTDVDSGTAAEIGYAAALGKWVVGYRDDHRCSGEDPCGTVNLQVEYLVGLNGGSIVATLRDLTTAVSAKLG